MSFRTGDKRQNTCAGGSASVRDLVRQWSERRKEALNRVQEFRLRMIEQKVVEEVMEEVVPESNSNADQAAEMKWLQYLSERRNKSKRNFRETMAVIRKHLIRETVRERCRRHRERVQARREAKARENNNNPITIADSTGRLPSDEKKVSPPALQSKPVLEGHNEVDGNLVNIGTDSAANRNVKKLEAMIKELSWDARNKRLMINDLNCGIEIMEKQKPDMKSRLRGRIEQARELLAQCEDGDK